MGNNACDNLERAFLLIGENISQYEENVKEKENGFDALYGLDTLKRQQTKSLIDTITAQLEVLNALTGEQYHWTRRDVSTDKIYSGICKVVDFTTFASVDVTKNFAE